MTKENWRDKDFTWDSKKPTTMLLGRWQPWHEGHQALFEEALKRTGQVIIMVRDTNNKNRKSSDPLTFHEVEICIHEALYEYRNNYRIMKVPNITNIIYGRKVGYNIEEVNLEEKIEAISGTLIREGMIKREIEEGELLSEEDVEFVENSNTNLRRIITSLRRIIFRKNKEQRGHQEKEEKGEKTT